MGFHGCDRLTAERVGGNGKLPTHEAGDDTVRIVGIVDHWHARVSVDLNDADYHMAIQGWFYPMTICQPLPTLPIWFSASRRVMLALEASCQETCRVLGIP